MDRLVSVKAVLRIASRNLKRKTGNGREGERVREKREKEVEGKEGGKCLKFVLCIDIFANFSFCPLSIVSNLKFNFKVF